MNEKNDSEPTAITPTETREAYAARLRKERIERESKRSEDTRVEREIEKELLIARFERELGPRGSAFDLHETGHIGDPIVVVKTPSMVQWTKYDQSKATPTDRYDFVSPSVVHPSQEEYTALRARRPGIDIPISNRCATLIGVLLAEDAGK